MGIELYDVRQQLTGRVLAPHSSIFTVHTVVGPNRIGRTVKETGLSSCTPDIVQPDLTSTIGEARGQGNSTCIKTILESQYPAGFLFCM
jgi:hypothetical protein